MAVGFNVGFFWYQIGTGDFLHCFFSTVAVNLENNKWGSNYPVIMNHLYQGKVEIDHIDEAISELKSIKERLADFTPDKVVWDIEDLDLLPPWGSNISSDINNLSNYFVTSEGEDFFDIFFHALEKSKELNLPIIIESL